MKEQVRLWFYSMLFMSTVLVDEPPYQQVGDVYKRQAFGTLHDEGRNAQRGDAPHDAAAWLHVGNLDRCV